MNAGIRVAGGVVAFGGTTCLSTLFSPSAGAVSDYTGNFPNRTANGWIDGPGVNAWMITASPATRNLRDDSALTIGTTYRHDFTVVGDTLTCNLGDGNSHYTAGTHSVTVTATAEALWFRATVGETATLYYSLTIL